MAKDQSPGGAAQAAGTSNVELAKKCSALIETGERHVRGDLAEIKRLGAEALEATRRALELLPGALMRRAVKHTMEEYLPAPSEEISLTPEARKAEELVKSAEIRGIERTVRDAISDTTVLLARFATIQQDGKEAVERVRQEEVAAKDTQEIAGIRLCLRIAEENLNKSMALADKSRENRQNTSAALIQAERILEDVMRMSGITKKEMELQEAERLERKKFEKQGWKFL